MADESRQVTASRANAKHECSKLCGKFLELARGTLISAGQQAKLAGDTITASRAQTAIEELYRTQDSNESFQRRASDELAAIQEEQTP